MVWVKLFIHKQENENRSLYYNNKIKMDYTVRSEVIKLLEGNIEKVLIDIGLVNDSFGHESQ
jgi:hypothetical protein